MTLIEETAAVEASAVVCSYDQAEGGNTQPGPQDDGGGRADEEVENDQGPKEEDLSTTPETAISPISPILPLI